MTPAGRFLRILAGVLLFLLLAVGCRTLPPPAGPAPDAAEWVRNLREQAQALRGLDAEAALELRRPDRHDRGDLLLVLEKPDRALLEITGPTGLVALATLNGGEFRFYDARHRRGMHGPITPYSIAQVMPWVVMPGQLVPILCATPPLLDVAPEPARWDSAQGRWLVTLHKPESALVQKLWFDPAGHLLALDLLTVGGAATQVNYSVRYLKWLPAGDQALEFPRFIRLTHPASGTEITLRLRGEPTLNRPPAPENFMLIFPDGTPLEYVPGDPEENVPPAFDPIRDLLEEDDPLPTP